MLFPRPLSVCPVSPVHDKPLRGCVDNICRQNIAMGLGEQIGATPGNTPWIQRKYFRLMSLEQMRT